jgi:glucose/arabinose dehydrogenase
MRPAPLAAVLLSCVLALAACGDDDSDDDDDVGDDAGDDDAPTMAMTEVASGLDNPLLVTSPPGDPRLFVIERDGLIKIIEDGEVLEDPFLDLTALVSTGDDERGLLGLAFHPDFATNRRFYVYYTAPGPGDPPLLDTVVEYVASDVDPNLADAASATTILEIDDPANNHNGGMMAFDPTGYLVIGTGDGGGSGDPELNGQDITSLLGKMLRIDIDDGDPYSIPDDNPLLDSLDENARFEIWHTGLRNPWRWSFDRETGDQWIGDVGQGKWEEVDRIPAGEGGHNLGWSDKEGLVCFEVDPCDAPVVTEPATEFTDPVAVYPNPSGDVSASVVGGYVYRGGDHPALVGKYFFADTYSGELWSIDADADPLPDPVAIDYGEPLEYIVSFGEDSGGEVYVVTLHGTIYRLDPLE